jgi:hypothetical protein
MDKKMQKLEIEIFKFEAIDIIVASDGFQEDDIEDK